MGCDCLAAFLLIRTLTGDLTLGRLKKKKILAKLNFEGGFGEIVDVEARWNLSDLNSA